MKKSIPLSAVWASVPLLLGATLGLSRAVAPHDYWWAVVAGREVASHGLVSTNTFLYTLPADAPFLNQPWLAQVLLHQFHALGGPLVGMLVLAAIAACFGAVIFRELRRAGVSGMHAGITVTIALMLAAPVVSVRTRMFAIPVALAICALLFRQTGSRTRQVWWCIPLIALWSNLHGSFVVGVAWCLLFVGNEVWEWLLDRSGKFPTTAVGFGVAATLAGMVNPLGANTYRYVAKLAVQSDVANTVTEWLPPSWDDPTGILFLAVVVATSLMVWRRRARANLFEVSAFALTVYLGASAIRSMLFISIIFPFLWEPTLGREQGGGSTSPIQSGINGTIIVASAVAVLACLPRVGFSGFDLIRGGIRTDDFGQGVFTTQNTRLVQDLDTVVFHDQAIGGQIEFVRGRQSAFVDQRMELIPESIWERYYRLSNADSGWEQLVEEYGITEFILSPDEQGALVLELLRHPRYRLTDTDDHHVRFLLLDGVQNGAKQNAADRHK